MNVRRPRHLAAVLVAMGTTLAVLLPPSPALACSCVFMEPAEALAQGAAAAFVGEMTGVGPAGRDGIGQPAMRWTFAVEAVVAGELAPTVVVIAAEDDGANCGLRAAPGERVGLLLHPTDAGWSSSSCSTYDADALLAAGEPYPPDPSLAAPAEEDPDPASAGRWLGIAAVALAGLAVLGLTALVVRRRRP